MSNLAIGLSGLGSLFALFMLRMPVGLSMLITGLLGTAAILGWKPALSSLTSEAFAVSNFSELVVLPMFVLMGNLAGACGMGAISTARPMFGSVTFAAGSPRPRLSPRLALPQ